MQCKTMPTRSWPLGHSYVKSGVNHRLILQNGLMKAAVSVFDGYLSLSMIVCACCCVTALGSIDIPSQRDLGETRKGVPPLPQTNAFAISPFRKRGRANTRPAWKYVSGAAR